MVNMFENNDRKDKIAPICADAAVIISIYKNDSAFNVYQAFLSLLNQTYHEFIILVYLDGPIQVNVDGLLQHLANQYQYIFIYRAEENKGLAFALNFMIDKILTEFKGIEFIVRMDADDISALNRLEKQISLLKQKLDIDILGAACQEFGVSNKILRKYESDSEIKKNIIKFTPFIHPTVVFRRRVFSSGYRYPQDTFQSEDLKFWFQLAKVNFRFYNMQDVLLFYRLSPATLNRRRNLNKAFSDFKSRFEYLCTTRVDITKNMMYILAQFILKFMPAKVLRFLYVKFR